MEIWKQVKDFPDYEVSNLGRFRKIGQDPRKWDYSSNKYIQVGLKNKEKKVTKLLHTLVIEAFIERPDYPCEVNHKDCNKSNNCIENLEYVTRQENLKHAEEHGRMDFKKRKGKDHPRFGVSISIESKERMRESHNCNGDHHNYILSDSQVLEIKKRRYNGDLVETLAIEFNQTKANISMICTGKRRSEVGPEYTIPAKKAKFYRKALRFQNPGKVI